MPDWVPGDWGTIKAGDLICVVWPTGNREGKVFDAGAGTLYLGYPNGSNVFAVESLRSDGGALFVPVPTQPELPTEYGWHVDGFGRAFHVSGIGRDPWAWWGDSETIAVDLLELPFTRLLPEAETAKRIISTLDQMRERGVWTIEGAQRRIAEEFGVSLD